MNGQIESLWVEKYRPQKLEEMVLDESVKKFVKQYLEKNTICNLTLVGRPGIGKTTLAKVIVNELQAQYLYINASSERGIDVIKTTIQDFCDSVGINVDRPKIVILDEADGLTADAQGSLRNLIETASSDTRFILTANFSGKLIEPLTSRCNPLNIGFGEKEAFAKIVDILKKENVKFSGNDVKTIYEEVVLKNFPDMRRIISIVEQCSLTGTFEFNPSIVPDEGIGKVASFIVANQANFRKCREFWICNESAFGANYAALSRELFNRSDDERVMFMIGDHLFKQAMSLDKEIAFASMILDMSRSKLFLT